MQNPIRDPLEEFADDLSAHDIRPVHPVWLQVLDGEIPLAEAIRLRRGKDTDDEIALYSELYRPTDALVVHRQIQAALDAASEAAPEQRARARHRWIAGAVACAAALLLFVVLPGPDASPLPPYTVEMTSAVPEVRGAAGSGAGTLRHDLSVPVQWTLRSERDDPLAADDASTLSVYVRAEGQAPRRLECVQSHPASTERSAPVRDEREAWCEWTRDRSGTFLLSAAPLRSILGSGTRGPVDFLFIVTRAPLSPEATERALDCPKTDEMRCIDQRVSLE